MSNQEKTYTIQEAKAELHKVVIQESKKLETYLKKQDNSEIITHI